jgi:hypothetical protein
MKKYINIIFALLSGIVTFIVPQFAQAQTNFLFTFDREYNNNPFRYVSAEESWVSSLAFSLEHEFKYIRLGYSGYYSRFDALGDRNFYWQQGYAAGTYKNIGIGLSLEQRSDRELYNFYDYRSAAGYTGYGISGDVWQVQSSVGGSINAFPNVSELDNKKAWLTLNGRRSFQTKTSIFAGGGMYYKRYDTVIAYDEQLPTGSADNPDVTQLVLWLRLTQSVTNTTGLAVYSQQRIITGGTNRFSEVYWFNGALESEMFDDPMGYEGNSSGIELTQLLPFEIMMKIAYNTVEKEYPDQGIFIGAEEYDSRYVREDSYRTFWFRFQKGIGLSSLNEIYLILSLNYQHIRNTSNSYWFGYKTSYISAGFDLIF